MVKKFKGAAAAALVLSMAFSSTAFAGVIYAPGINERNEAGPNGAAEQVAPGQTAETSAQTGTQQTGSSTAVQAGSTAQTQSSSTQTQNTAQTQSTAQAQSAATVPGTTGPVAAGPGETAQTAQTETVDLGSDGQGVEVDSILGETPILNAAFIEHDGTTPAFSTNSGALSTNGDGFTGLWMCYDKAIGDVYYRVYTAQHGWSKWAMNEMRTPDYGDGSNVAGVEVRIKGHTANIYDIYYRVTLNDGTQLGWAHNGEAAGSFGTDKYIKSMEIRLFKKGTGKAAGYQQAANYEGVVFGDDGKAVYSTFDGSAYTGWAYDTSNNKYYFKDSHIVTGWQYIDGYKYYFDDNGVVVTDLEPIIGLTGDYIIKINKSMKTLTVYAKDGSNGYIIPVKVILTTIGKDTPLGTFKTYEAYRWKYMHAAEGGAYYCQYLLRFKNGYILHSIIYQGAADSYKLIADTYNQLGKNQSDGCVRMLSGDAAWVYTNCGVGTQVTIYEDEWVTGPFDRPAIEQAIPRTQNYDPTDPVIVKKQQQEAADAARAAAEAAQKEAATGIEAEPQATAE